MSPGLTRESSPAAGEYGVYFYCNDRLVARAKKTMEVGFTKGLAGLPHPKVSLTRGLVKASGPDSSEHLLCRPRNEYDRELQ